MAKGIVIFVPGLPGWGLTDGYWESAFDNSILPANLCVLTVKPSPIASHHDRACEIFAEITGTLVDYGIEHSQRFKHSRWGKDYSNVPPLHSEWGTSNPIHLVCHSTAINTARVLQRLLEDDFWNKETSSKWILSITSINGALNECAVSDVINKEILHLISRKFVCKECNNLGCSFCIHIKIQKAAKMLSRSVTWAAMSKLKLNSEQRRQALNWPADQWIFDKNNDNNNDVSQHLSDDEVVNKLNSSLKSGIFNSGDNIIYDQTFDGISKLEEVLNKPLNAKGSLKNAPNFIHNRTFYLCLFSSATISSTLHIPSEMSPILWPFSAILLDKTNESCLDDHTKNIIQKIQTVSSNVDPLRDNDGLVTVINQCVPRGVGSTFEVFPKRESFPSLNKSVRPGIWYIDNVNRWIDGIQDIELHHDVDRGNVSKINSISNKQKSNFLWDHFDACWSRTLLKSSQDQVSLDSQRSLYRNIFLYISSVQLFFENSSR
ncbi:hypothetical protein MN116_003241 [Schistosoma mekongi]|uniref:Lipase-like C-terminal domain-containing protein n=1 Tax=Schistosoma mekongi TaxID=38744 RepID=A0AAE1ZGM8_SCHME|nr:hypothetical protein MN116_003241 [Schistosoma mekongi]